MSDEPSHARERWDLGLTDPEDAMIELEHELTKVRAEADEMREVLDGIVRAVDEPAQMLRLRAAKPGFLHHQRAKGWVESLVTPPDRPAERSEDG